MSIRVLPPDVHQSGLYFTPVGSDVRFGLAAIKNVGENTAKAICDARETRGAFTSLYDFCESIDSRSLNKRVLESLIKAGALDCFGASRARHFAAIDDAVACGQRAAQRKAVGQHGLFLAGSSPASVDWEGPRAAGSRRLDRGRAARREYTTLGFYISGHPLDKFGDRLKELKAVDIGSFETWKNNQEIVLGGIIVQSRAMRSKRGAKWAIITLQDRTGAIESLVLSGSVRALGSGAEAGHAAVGEGQGRRRGGRDSGNGGGSAGASSGGGTKTAIAAGARGFVRGG